MVNRQIVSTPEREALASESNFWKSAEQHLLKAGAPSDRIYQLESGPIPLHRLTPIPSHLGLKYLYVDSLVGFRKEQGCGNIHWVTTWNVVPDSPSESTKLYILLATAQPIHRSLDAVLTQLIQGSRSLDDAMSRMETFRAQQAAIESEWDITFLNQSYGRPSPWTWLSGFWVSNPEGIDESVLKFLGISLESAGLYNRLWPETSNDYVTAVHRADHEEYRKTIAQRLIFAHTARSMWLRTMPRQMGVRHQTTNDAPSYGLTRVLIMLRIKDLYPDAYEIARHFLPTTTQRKLMNARVRHAIGTAQGETGDALSDVLPIRKVLPKKPDIAIPDGMTNWIEKTLDFITPPPTEESEAF